MTDLVAPRFMVCRPEGAVEQWHGAVMPGNVIACVVVRKESGGAWVVTAELKDKSLRRIGDQWQSGPYDSQVLAHEAGSRAVARLHRIMTIAGKLKSRDPSAGIAAGIVASTPRKARPSVFPVIDIAACTM